MVHSGKEAQKKKRETCGIKAEAAGSQLAGFIEHLVHTRSRSARLCVKSQFGSQEDLESSPSPVTSSCVSFGKFLNLSGPQLSQLATTPPFP